MVEVDYEAIDLLLQARHMSRRQLAKIIGVSPDTLAGSFRRKSKMKLFQLWQISKALSVQLIELLSTDANGEYNQEDIEKIESGKFSDDFFRNEDKIEEIIPLLEKLNDKGLEAIESLAYILSDIPELQANYTVSHSTVATGEYSPTPEEFQAFMNKSSESEDK